MTADVGEYLKTILDSVRVSPTCMPDLQPKFGQGGRSSGRSSSKNVLLSVAASATATSGRSGPHFPDVGDFDGELRHRLARFRRKTLYSHAVRVIEADGPAGRLANTLSCPRLGEAEPSRRQTAQKAASRRFRFGRPWPPSFSFKHSPPSSTDTRGTSTTG